MQFFQVRSDDGLTGKGAGEMRCEPQFFHRLFLVLSMAWLGGCAMVEVKPLGENQYIAAKRGDILTTGKLSAASEEAIRVAGLEETACRKPSIDCIDALTATQGIADERRLSTLSELWLQESMMHPAPPSGALEDERIDAWLETARHAYAYLFFSERSPDQRAFEDRQTQVRDYYAYAVQQATTALFKLRSSKSAEADFSMEVRYRDWDIELLFSSFRLPEGVKIPQEVVPASSLSFQGLRSIYRRDGFGAELVAVVGDDPMTLAAPPPAMTASGGTVPDAAPRSPDWSEMPSPSVTMLFHFQGDDLAQVLSTRKIQVSAHDPYQDVQIEMHGQWVPLAANFTAGYGLWLAQSGFARQSLNTLLGREQGIVRPHLYMMQPYDPDRRIILMIHGLASSPEAWVNVANEVMGDETLRRDFQIWQIYYPTNGPIALNHFRIREIVAATLRHFDPDDNANASHDMVVMGHSMGGVIARLIVSSSGDKLWNQLLQGRRTEGGSTQRINEQLGPMLRFQPLPNVERAIFIAAPHRGTPLAGRRLGRWISRLVRLPITLLEGIGGAVEDLTQNQPKRPDGKSARLPNSIDNLSEADPFVRAAADLPISPQVPYHSIIAQRDPGIALKQSDDGLVPYSSSHLDGAVTEKIIISGHSVQETAPAILEIRRILHQDLLESGTMRPVSKAPQSVPVAR